MKIVSTTIMLLAVSLVPALAQQQRGPGGQPPPERPQIQRDAFRSGRNVDLPGFTTGGAGGGRARTPSSQARVLDIDAASRTILIRRADDNQEMRLHLDPDCKIKVGKKDLTLEEIKTGYEIETIVLGRKGRVTEIRGKTP